MVIDKDRVLKLNRFDTEPDDATANKLWAHWSKFSTCTEIFVQKLLIDGGTRLGQVLFLPKIHHS